MPTIAIGDIHGDVTALDDLLRQLRPALSHRDTVVFLGDYIDRGTDSRACVDIILRFREEVPGSVVCLKGNHEDWMLRASADFTHHSWLLGMDALPTIRSYSPGAAEVLQAARGEGGLRLYTEKYALPYDRFFDALPPGHRTFFEALQLSHRTDDCLCSHAGVNPLLPLDQQPPRDLVWGAAGFPERYVGEEAIVYGHKACRDVDDCGWPLLRIHGRTFGIDTIGQGVLTALRLPDLHIWRGAAAGFTAPGAPGA